MKQREFVQRYASQWDDFDDLLKTGTRAKDPNTQQRLFGLPERYRQMSQQLALARDRNYSPSLVERLNLLVLRGHHRLHRPRPISPARVGTFLLLDFPRQVRRDRVFIWLALGLLYLPALVMIVAMAIEPGYVYEFIPPSEAETYERMYDPDSSHFARERESDSDFLMFGFYIRNNIGIGFQTYAGGILFGLGSVFHLVFNGLFLGALSAHIHAVGYGSTFLAFVITHGAFELTAIAFAGAAGLKLGWAILAPGRLPRVAALVRAGRESVIIITGVAAMLFAAAFIEAFWSSSTLIPDVVKFAVGTLCWLLVAFWFLRAGGNDGS